MRNAAPMEAYAPEKASTGIAGLDDVLGGGFPANRLNLVEGSPGTGKTTLALQFLLEGVRRGETVLYVTLSETAAELKAVAQSHGWSLDGVILSELSPHEESLRPEEQYTVFHPAEVELGETTWAVLEEAERSKPSRVVFDSLAELRLLARDSLRYRRQILGLKQFFAGRHCTVLLLDSMDVPGNGLESICHSVTLLEHLSPEYGSRERRRLRVVKVRGASYRGGYHDFVMRTGGITVFPSLIAAEHAAPVEPGQVASEVPELDSLVGGGLDRGSSALFIGPAGVGKSALATQYALAAVRRGEPVTAYITDESVATYLNRARGLEMDIEPFVQDGRMRINHLDPAQLSPGEFDALVRRSVEVDNARIIVLDSLNGYLNAMAEEHLVLLQLHELLTYLGHQGVLTIMTIAQHGVIGDRMQTPVDVSYLADSVVMLRYFEAGGEIRQAISVVKRRGGPHERTIRELRMGPGIRVGSPLHNFQAVLSGTPTYTGPEGSLLPDGDR
jgi:circadian clock protein KaiC